MSPAMHRNTSEASHMSHAENTYRQTYIHAYMCTCSSHASLARASTDGRWGHGDPLDRMHPHSHTVLASAQQSSVAKPGIWNSQSCVYVIVHHTVDRHQASCAGPCAWPHEKGGVGSPQGLQSIREKLDTRGGAPQALAEIPHTRVTTAGGHKSMIYSHRLLAVPGCSMDTVSCRCE